MGKELYDSIVSKIALVAPMFAKAIVDIGLEKFGVTPYEVTPFQMKKIINEEVFPRLKKYVKSTETLETIGGGEITFGEKGQLISINMAARRLLGLKSDAELSYVCMQEVMDKLQLTDAVTKILDGRDEVFIKEIKLEEPRVRLNVIGGALRDENRRLKGVTIFLQDITLRIALEAEVDLVYEKLEEKNKELKKYYEDLEDLVDKRTAELQKEIIEHKQVEEALKWSEERFRALTESTSDWVWEVNQNGVYTYASPKVKDLLGYEPEEIVGKTPFDFMPTEEAKKVAEKFGELVKEKRVFMGLENTNIHKDGRLIVLETSGVPFFDAKGRLCGYRGIDRDITERKRMEKLLMNQEKLVSIGQLAAGVAHELNNPLTTIVSLNDLLTYTLDGRLKEEERRNLGLIKESSLRMKRIISDLNKFSRSSKGGERTPLDINIIIDKVMELLKSDVKREEIEVKKELGTVPLLPGEGDKLMQVFINLFSNSRDALRGKVEKKIWIKTEYKEKEGMIIVSFRDNGIGIGNDVINKIFDPFFTTKLAEKGTGLGLSIIYGIVKEYGGDIEVKSKQGEFTEFLMKFKLLNKE